MPNGDDADRTGESLDISRAKLKAVELLLETPDERMAELTVISRRQSLNLSLMVMNEASAAFMRAVMEGKPEGERPELVLLSEVWRKSYYQHQRSIGAKHLDRAKDMAEAQTQAEIPQEEFSEPKDF